MSMTVQSTEDRAVRGGDRHLAAAAVDGRDAYVGLDFVLVEPVQYLSGDGVVGADELLGLFEAGDLHGRFLLDESGGRCGCFVGEAFAELGECPAGVGGYGAGLDAECFGGRRLAQVPQVAQCDRPALSFGQVGQSVAKHHSEKYL